MKKVFRTFLMTLMLVLVGGIIGIYIMSEKQPEKIKGFLGCTSSSQELMHKELMQKLDLIEQKINQQKTEESPNDIIKDISDTINTIVGSTDEQEKAYPIPEPTFEEVIPEGTHGSAEQKQDSGSPQIGAPVPNIGTQGSLQEA